MSPVTELLIDRVADAPSMPTPRLDRAAVRAFAESLGVHHRTATFYPWRRLPNGRRVMHPAGHVIGLTDATFARLEVANAAGWDIALCLNEMSGQGHRAPDVLSVIVISADLDNSVPASWPGGIAPTIIVETSPAKFQAHWRLKDEMEIAAGGAPRSAMVAALGGDTGANSANQGMRPFGSVNHKYGAPFLAGHAGGSGEAVAASALSGAYPAPVKKATPSAPRNQAYAPSSASDAIAKLDHIINNCNFTVQGRRQWLAVGAAIAFEAGLRGWLRALPHAIESLARLC